MPTDQTPSRNENEYFARENLELLQRLRAARDVERSADTTGSPMACPRCSQALVEREYHHVKIDECAACGGVWLDRGELALLEQVQPESRRHFISGLFGRGG